MMLPLLKLKLNQNQNDAHQYQHQHQHRHGIGMILLLWTILILILTSSSSSVTSTSTSTMLEGRKTMTTTMSRPAATPSNTGIRRKSGENTNKSRMVMPFKAATVARRRGEDQEKNATTAVTTTNNNSSSNNSSSSSSSSSSSATSSTTNMNPDCTLCQGLELMMDHKPEYSLQPKYPNIYFIGIPPNATCGEIEMSLQQMYDNNNNTNISVCRSNSEYNYFFSRCCRAALPRYECETNVHETIFGDETGGTYNPAVPPIPAFGGGDGDDPLEVYVQLQFEALEHIDVEEGISTIFATLILSWNDPRLAWDITPNTTCSSYVNVFAGVDPQVTSIWVPDFDLFNQIDGTQTFPMIQPTVYSDGTVLWVRSGGVTAFCSFMGLGEIPYDMLGCQYMFGSRNRLDKGMIRYKLRNESRITFGPFKAVYNEWLPVPEKADASYSLDGELIYFDFWFERARAHYINNIVVPTIILTYTSFLTFLLDLRVGERLGFGMALLLVVVAQQIIILDLIPVSNSRLWIDKFIAWSFYWALLGLVESVVIGFLWYLREDRTAKEEKRILSDPEELVSLTNQSGDEAAVRTAAGGGNAVTNNIIDDFEINPLSDDEILGTSESTKVAMTVSDEHKVAPASKEPKMQKENSDDNCLKFLFYNYSLRRLDYTCLVLAILSYTVFIAFMFISVQQEESIWSNNEPTWFTADTQYSENAYELGNPDA